MRISEVVEKAAHDLDPKLECTTMGSYRRGQVSALISPK